MKVHWCMLTVNLCASLHNLRVWACVYLSHCSMTSIALSPQASIFTSVERTLYILLPFRPGTVRSKHDIFGSGNIQPMAFGCGSVHNIWPRIFSAGCVCVLSFPQMKLWLPTEGADRTAHTLGSTFSSRCNPVVLSTSEVIFSLKSLFPFASKMTQIETKQKEKQKSLPCLLSSNTGHIA